MGILKNPRHELFAQELAKGKSATEAYTLAGYKASRQNAARLTTNDDIRARLAELQATAAKASEVTIQSLLNELEDARVKASNLDQLSAAVRAIEAKAKVSGLLVQKIEVTTADDDFDSAETVEDVAAALVRHYNDKGYELTPAQRTEFAELLVSWVTAIDEYAAGCCAKPVQPVMSDRDRETVAQAPGPRSSPSRQRQPPLDVLKQLPNCGSIPAPTASGRESKSIIGSGPRIVRK